uniref:Protein kinase domain-containing protein n=1 Tax=Lotharella globosa TaxID=91324 RepID=A0A7S3Z3Z1_9EUKA
MESRLCIPTNRICQTTSSKKRRQALPSIFACCRAMDDRGANGKASRLRQFLPKRYAYQFTLRQTLFGEIACAIDMKHNRRVAIKISSKDRRFFKGGEDPCAEAKIFRLFAKTLARSASESSVESQKGAIPSGDMDGRWHPNIIRYYGASEDSEKIWTAMEFAHRGELLDHITNSPDSRLSEDEASRIIGQVSQGLAFCHSNRIAHLDISPENVLLTRGWTAKICDFGLAKRMNSKGIVIKPHYTGKANYMAPEAYAASNRNRSGVADAGQAKKGIKFAGAPADVFSLGIVMFLCITGVLPYQYPTKSDRRYTLVTGGRKALGGLLKRWGIAVSAEAKDLLASMLHAEPSKRATIDDILHHPWILSGQESEARANVQPPTPKSPATPVSSTSSLRSY